MERIGLEIKGFVAKLQEGAQPQDSQKSLDQIVKLAVKYIAQWPNKIRLQEGEEVCLQLITNKLKSNWKWEDRNNAVAVFHELYSIASSEITDQRQRDLLSNLILFSLETDAQYCPWNDVEVPVSHPVQHAKFSIGRSSSSTNSSSKLIGNSSSQNGNRMVGPMDAYSYDSPQTSLGLDNESTSDHRTELNTESDVDGVFDLNKYPMQIVGPTTGRSYDSSQTNVGLGNYPIPSYTVELSRQKNFDNVHDVVQNAIYSFVGVQGKYLKKDVITGRFKLDPINKVSLTEPQCGMLMRLSQLGYYHDCVAKFSNISTGYNAMGSMGQAFMSKLKLELSEFHGKVALLQDQLNEHRHLMLYYYKGDQRSSMNSQPKKLTLNKLLIWYMEPMYRMEWLTRIANACLMKKGGELASVLYDFLEIGNPLVDTLASDLLTACCGPLVRMISKWMLEGGIDDGYGEFFVESLADVGVDRLWHDKFRLRLHMLPKFITRELADKILKTGKSINFLREVCKMEGAVKGRKELKDVIDNHVSSIFSYVPDTQWHAVIETCYSQTSKNVLDIMVGPHKLLDHLQGMRRYLLLGQGDFVGIFIENIKDELEKVGTDIYSHDLSAMLDAALRCTNAQYDDADILNHLDVVVKTPYSGDCGWDVISLQYTVRGPLATMLEPAMPTYKSLFKPLWRIKHMEFVLSTKIWKLQMANAKALRSLSGEISKITYRLNLFTSEIMHFVHQMQYYVLFEVIECNWVELQKRMQQATALDDILDAHSDFLHAISVGCFVNTSTNMESYLEVVYENIILLDNWQSNFYQICFNELAARQLMAEAIADSEQTGRYGLTTEQKMERDEELKIFEQRLVASYRALEIIAASYGKAVGDFLLALNSSNDPNLQLFGTRLDFNEYYKKRDTNLSKPLTFEHWRMSNVFGTSRSLSGVRHSIYPQATNQISALVPGQISSCD
ncbi:gamma-tubulin complex component 3 [Drosophila grimshawi]|uniref:GH12885 n=1 Tax=Drosophila grimshawi TaxID=7222 RepID=B4JLL1_DROGR|nr:gamma-tubulin complex component 3 [Drosophila grimshawi]EDW00464.1 GH12885 [Drosophila grimshawi]